MDIQMTWGFSLDILEYAVAVSDDTDGPEMELTLVTWPTTADEKLPYCF
jgi:hypothetical protein